MGFFQKVKQFLGIGGVKLRLQGVPAEVKKDEGVITGTMVLTSKSDQLVSSVEVKLEEEYTTGRGDNKSTTTFDLGELVLEEEFEMKAGDTKEIPFSLSFELLASKNDEMMEKGGASKALGMLGKAMNAEKSTYSVEASAKVKGTAFGPSDSKEIKLK